MLIEFLKTCQQGIPQRIATPDQLNPRSHVENSELSVYAIIQITTPRDWTVICSEKLYPHLRLYEVLSYQLRAHPLALRYLAFEASQAKVMIPLQQASQSRQPNRFRKPTSSES